MADQRCSIAAVVVLLFLLVGIGHAQTETITPKETLAHWAEAWQSGSVEKCLTFYHDSKSLFAVASSGHSYRGLAGVRRMYAAAFDEATWERVALKDLEIQENGNVAWGKCRFVADFTPSESTVQFVFTSQGTFVLLKVGADWKIAMEHFSPIVDVPRVQRRKDR